MTSREHWTAAFAAFFACTALLFPARRANCGEPPNPSSAAPNFAVALSDGSRLVGEMEMSKLAVSTAFAVVEIPLDQIAQVTRPGSEATVSIRCKNGDQFKGTLSARTIPIKTAFGKYALPVDLITGISAPAAEQQSSTPAISDSPSKRNQCINHLRMIDAAKEQWALAEAKGDGVEPDPVGVAQYLKGGRMPTCPAGGVYKLNPIGINPKCSVPGHELPDLDRE